MASEIALNIPKLKKRIMFLFLRDRCQRAVAGTNQCFRRQRQNLFAHLLPRPIGFKPVALPIPARGRPRLPHIAASREAWLDQNPRRSAKPTCGLRDQCSPH